jgi:hypothetical protein
MTDQIWERLDPLIARWKKFEPHEDADRLSALEHAPTSELQRLMREVDAAKADIDSYCSALEAKYGLYDNGELGATTAADAKEAKCYDALRALKAAYDEAAEEIADRESAGEA